MAPELFVAGSALGGLVLGLGGKIAYDFIIHKKLPQNVPHAQNGFMTLKELQEFCDSRQTHCHNMLKKDLELLLVKVETRLAEGDRIFTEVKLEMEKTEGILKQHSLALGRLENGARYKG